MVLVLGLTVTGIVTAYAQSLLSQTARVERLVVQRTSELQEANASLAYERFLLSTLLEFSPDFIYFKDQESRFIRISRAWPPISGSRDLPQPSASRTSMSSKRISPGSIGRTKRR